MTAIIICAIDLCGLEPMKKKKTLGGGEVCEKLKNKTK